MRSAQPRLAAETRTGSGTSAYSLSTRAFSDLVAAGWFTTREFLARVGSAVGVGGFGDMPIKPANLGGPKPVNTLAGNSPASRTPYGIPSSSRTIPSSPPPISPQSPESSLGLPPAKRLKLSESESSTVRSRATLSPVDPSTPGKRSAGSRPVPDLQPLPISEGIPELRVVDRWTKPGRARKRHNHPGHGERLEDGRAEPSILLEINEDISEHINDKISEDDVDFIGSRKTSAVSRTTTKRKQSETRPVLDISHNFKGNKHSTRMFSGIVDIVERKEMFPELDLTPDELAPSPEDIAARPSKRLKTLPRSVSKKGNISSTKFIDISDTGPPIATRAANRQMDGPRRSADSIIGQGLRILRGVSGQCSYETACESDPEDCLLSVREEGHILFPIDNDSNPLTNYKYLTIDIKRVKSILIAPNEEESRIVTATFESANLSTGAGPRLMVEFASTKDLSRFKQWVALYRPDDQSIIKGCKSAKLEGEFREMIKRTKRHTMATEAPIGDDIRLIQHNRNSRATGTQASPRLATESSAETTVRGSMTSSSFHHKSRDDAITTSQAWDDKQMAAQQTRATRSTSASSPPESRRPEPESWTSVNPNWERQWRNSLVYPTKGRNRAIVDKDDIQRLDEGQFLNDNIIIFYLRYLQQKLEDDQPELAERVYFHNTFFYDKLKPVKSGQGINYDSVKAWTSKVDLFSKDYIIVPINEYTHWYVAIIYNAPKLVLPTKPHEQVDAAGDGAGSNVIAVPDDAEIIQKAAEASSKGDTQHGDVSGEYMNAPAQESVIQSLRCMSIDSTGQPHSENKQETDNNAGEEGVDSMAAKNDHEVHITDSNKPGGEVEHIVTVTSSQDRKKMKKGQNAGARKYDPEQPRIITLDSLGATHSPTCNYLRQYLTAELQDKRGITPTTPTHPKGITARGVPEQTNHCDCGLFLLGYIQQFLVNPDAFIKSLLQRDDKISWNLDPSELRNNIRDLIFDLQKQQQKAEDLIREQKDRARKMARARRESVSRMNAPTAGLAPSPSNSDPTIRDCSGSKLGEDKNMPASPISRPTSSKGNVIGGGAVDSEHQPNSKATPQSPAPSIQDKDSETTRQLETSDRSDGEVPTESKTEPHVIVLPRESGQLNDEADHQTSSALPMLPVQDQAVRKSGQPDNEANHQTSIALPILPVQDRVVKKSRRPDEEAAHQINSELPMPPDQTVRKSGQRDDESDHQTGCALLMPPGQTVHKPGQRDDEVDHQTKSALAMLPAQGQTVRKFRVPDDEADRQISSTFPMPSAQGQTIQRSPPSSEIESSVNIRPTSLPPLVSETPSTKSSRGATPQDPVVLEEPDNDSRDEAYQYAPAHRGIQPGFQLVVELPSKNRNDRPEDGDNETHSRKQTGKRSSYFANRKDGERVTAAKLRDETRNDVIDLSDD